MFGPRGTLPQRPRGPNPSGTKPPGSFQDGGASGLQRKPMPAIPQGLSQRFSGLETFPWQGSQRINVRVTLHRPDPRQVKKTTNLHQEQKGEPCTSRWDSSPCSTGTTGPKPSLEQNSNAQNCYTPESASSILASFGLSNEDLEELSRYPDDQLTPENMPLILREIRVWKMGHSSSLRAPSPGEDTGGGAVESKVIDYRYTSKYSCTEDRLEARVYDPEVPTDDPLEARGYNPEASSGENREDFQRVQNMPVGLPPPGVSCNPVFPVEDLIKQTGFQNGSSTTRSFFPAEPMGKVSGLCAAPARLPMVKIISQPAVPPVMPPLLPPPHLPPLAQPAIPPVVPPPVSHHMLLPATQPPFSTELLTTLNSHERIQWEGTMSQPNTQSGAGARPKPLQMPPEEPTKSPFGVVKPCWLPAFPESDSQKRKRLPTPSVMNDYYATSPRIFPHICSLCNIECSHMKYWILHQNSTSHIESCRQLRQQYPDWNPESHSSKRNAGERKENQTLRRRSSSTSPSPRRSRVTSSTSVLYRSRSRSRSPGRFRPRRPRSRSPHGMRRFSPRHRSRSPQRSRNTLRTSARLQRSSSSSWTSERSTRSEDRKAALEAIVKSLGHAFLAKFNKHKSEQGSSGSGKSQPSPGPLGKVPGKAKTPLKRRVSTKALKKDKSPLPVPGSSSPETTDLPKSEEKEKDEEDESTGTSEPHPAPYNRLLREELLSRGTVLHISDLPDDGFSDQDIKKIVQPFGKVSDLLVLRSRNEAFLEMNYKEAVMAAVEYGETVPVLVNSKRVTISVAEKPKASPEQVKTNLKKRARKAVSSMHKDRDPTAKTMKAIPAEAAADGDIQISTEAEMEVEETKPLDAPSVTEGDGDTEPVKVAETESDRGTDAAPVAEQVAEEPLVEALGVEDVNEAVIDEGAAVVTVEGEEAVEPPSKDPDDMCVVLVSNLPEKGYSVEDISNLAKPFGGVRDVLIVSSHKKAYLEINRKSADSMVKFYSCFPMSLDGNQLCIDTVPQCPTVRDEEAIFAAIIKDSDPKVDTETVHHQFVHLGNLPDDGYRELEAVCVGLRFGKVDHYVVLKNKNKAIVQLDSPRSARSMYSFLQQYPYRMGEHTLTCTLSPHGDFAEAEVGKKDVKKEEPSGGSSGLTKYPEGSGVVQTAAASPPVEPSVAKKGPGPISNGKEKSAAQIEPSESHLDGAVRESSSGPAEMSVEQVDAGAEAPVVSVKPADIASLEVKSEEILLPSSVKEEDVDKDSTEPKQFESTVVLTSEQEATEEDEALPAPSIEPLEELSTVDKAEDVLLDHTVKLEAQESMEALPEVMPPASAASSVEAVSSLVTQTNNKLNAPDQTVVSDVKTEHEMFSDVKTKHESPVTQITEKKPVLKTEVVVEKKLDVSGAETEVKPEEPGLQGGRAVEENLGNLLVKSGAEMEMKLEKSMTKVGAVVEDAGNAINENNEGRLVEAHRNKGTGEPKSDETCKTVPFISTISVKESPSVDKMLLKAVVCLPDISKSRVPAQRNDHSMGKGRKQKAPLKRGRRDQASVGKRMAPKEEGHPRGGSGCWSLGGGKCKASRSCGLDGKGGSGRNSSQQEESRAESRASSKQSQEGESRSSNTKRDNTSNKASIGGNAKALKGGTSSDAKQKEEEELFPFKLDEFVTVDEVVEDIEAPVKTWRNPPRGKRKPNSFSESSSKRRKRKSSVAHMAESDLSFVTLDEIGEEEDMAAQLMGISSLEALGDPQGLVVVDEVMEEEELLEAVKDPESLVTLDEICEQEDLGSHKDVPQSIFEEQDLKAEPLVTIDEIGEVEELPLSEPTDLIEDVLTRKENDKGAAEDSGDGASAQVLDDPSAFVTVDEIQEDNEDIPLEALDEANEDDFLADFNQLKEELNFVTVDEVGEEDEEEENTSLGKNVNEEENNEDIVAVAGPEEEKIAAIAGPEEEDIVAVAGPEEMEILGEMRAEEEIISISKAKGEQLGSGEKEPESKQKKMTSTDVLKAQSTPKDLDYLVPKAGFFCQICSLFYADETSVKKHCKTLLHQQNLEKFMAKQKDEDKDGEECSSR